MTCNAAPWLVPAGHAPATRLVLLAQADMSVAKLDPFNQADILARLAALEAKVLASGSNSISNDRIAPAAPLPQDDVSAERGMAHAWS